jgi:catechol 2,3-dioxygenase-like lactoylglutathione lyase family enzyme
MKVDGIDHLVLTVENIELTCDFYNRVLGMEVISFGRGRKALAFGCQKINLHQIGNEFEPKASNPTPGSADICLITSVPMPDVLLHLKSNGIKVLEQAVQRTGARGILLSTYFRDPDSNLIEISNYEIT